MQVKVKAVRDYFDVETNEKKYAKLPSNAKETQHIWVTSKERAEDLLKVNPKIIEILEEIKPVEATRKLTDDKIEKLLRESTTLTTNVEIDKQLKEKPKGRKNKKA